MRRSVYAILSCLTLLLLLPEASRAQRVYLTPMVGTHVAAADFQGLGDEADDIFDGGHRPLVVGLNAELGPLRGSVAYAPDARQRRGFDGATAGGSVLAAAADLVIRPIPRLLVLQPYLLGGLGYKRRTFPDGLAAAYPALADDRHDLAFHLGVGTDLMFGRRVGLAVEVTDFITSGDVDELGRHDVFAAVGLRVRAW